MIGAAALLAGCATTPGDIGGGGRIPSFAALQQMCGREPVDFGAYTAAVYVATFDASVANRRGRLSQAQFCGFQEALAQHYKTLGTSSDPKERNQWVIWLNVQRAQAISWRAAADPTLRAG